MIETLKISELRPGVTLRILQTPVFKTTTIKLFIHLPLDEHATANALLVRVLGRGCRQYPTMRKISILMDSLYGAMFGADISKIGERHIIEFFFEFVSQLSHIFFCVQRVFLENWLVHVIEETDVIAS